MSDARTPDDRTVVDYLLGALSADETEQLDELSIADDDFAARLTATENDLVDAYVRGRLPDDLARRVRDQYVASPARQQKLRFAQALLDHQTRAATAARLGDTRRNRTGLRWPGARWLAAAALLFIAAGTFLVFDNARLRRQLLTDSQEARATLVLRPATRGASSLATVVVPEGVSSVRLTLSHADVLPLYEASLKDASQGRTIWQSGSVPGTPRGDVSEVTITVPANVLSPQTYVLELRGRSASGESEVINSYPFRVANR